MLKFISETNLNSWLTELAKDFQVFAPRQEGKGVVWRAYDSASGIDLSTQPLESAKHIVFPRSQELLHYRYIKQENGERELQIEEAAAPARKVIFGARPCDARGFFTFDPVYDGKVKDLPYLKARNATVIVGLSCNEKSATCFCHWVGSSPVDENGADLMLTPVNGGYVVAQITERGKALFESPALQNADGAQTGEAEAFKKAALDRLESAPDLSEAPQKILARFEDMDFWRQQSYKCLACGACTYLCPTCYCFNITDETSGNAGARLRSWDACMSSNFTLEGSGHNPRPSRFHRMKNRVGHKFSYYPELHGYFACCGCGRCIKSCPVTVDIREIVLAAVNYKKPVSEEAKHG